VTITEKRSEAELAQLVIDYLRQDGWAFVYQEVPFNGIAADIVVRNGNLIGVIECKQNLGLDVIEQAHRWRGLANLVWCATWTPKRGYGFGKIVATEFGIGIIDVDRHNHVTERKRPNFLRRKDERLLNALRPEMMSGEYGKAGSQMANRFTPFKETCIYLQEVVSGNPGIELKDAIKKLKRHHYASDAAARANLKKMIEQNVVSGVKINREGGKIILQPS
jgi:hypothetical protein